MKRTKTTLFHSVIALLLCASMLAGTTFAWFTDSISSGVNTIKAGNLDVELEYLDDFGNWKTVEDSTSIFDENALWEPGYTEVVYLRISNRGNLALKYQLGINIVSEIGSVNQENEPFLLSNYIEFGVVEGVSTRYADRSAARKAVTSSKLISEGYSEAGAIEAKGADQYVALVVYMPEETGNAANYMTGENPPKIELGISLVATQQISESDSFGSDYDSGAAFPREEINFSVGQSVSSKVVDNMLIDTVTIGDTDGDIYAVVPDGVQMAEGSEVLQLSVSTKDTSEATITLNDGEAVLSLDVHMEGVSEGNTVPMQITLKGVLPTGLNDGNVKLYHVENGATVSMTRVYSLDDLSVHNQFYYAPATGDVVMCVATFSEYDMVVNNLNLWRGTIDTAWYNPEATVFELTTADQLAGLGAIVDGTAEGIEADTFGGKIIKLGADINLSGGYSLNPIGCGYADSSINSKGVEGRVFSGTFDGCGYTISGLYQNGWEIGLSYCNLGGGLFASLKDATIKNLTISGAEIVMECVEMGVLAGLVQGSCTFDNINIYGCSIANYQKATGGLIGEVSGSGTTTISNVNIDSTTVVGSLWGDFDCPVGGVIGARWDNEGADPEIRMENVNVACRLDVYNDVTSAYQWYAYRRAGMLIGNTEESTDHTATADFLTCTNVVVCYGDWVNYNYCEFTNQDNTWCNNYPWVRVEAGEHCSAYSNPRYGQPIIGGATIADSLHSHAGNDEHLVPLAFKQLYGGGQGVYGQDKHNGVTEAKYTITYINYGEVLGIDLITESDLDANGDYTINRTATATNKTFIEWVDANDNRYPVGSKITLSSDIILYPVWGGEFTINFLDAENNLLYYEVFISNTNHTLDQEAVNTALADLQKRVDASGEIIEVSWDTETYDFVGATSNIVVRAVYTLKNSTITLSPVYDEDGMTIVSYSVSDVADDIEEYKNIAIPSHVGTVPVDTIGESAFAGYKNLVSVVIPETITSINANAFEDGPTWYDGGRQTITIYYEGNAAIWKKYMDNFYKSDSYYTQYNELGDYEDNETILNSGWDSGLGDGSRIFFLGADGMVDNSCYWELYKHWETSSYKYTWVFHNHAYDHENKCSCDDSGSVSGDVTDYINDLLKDGSARPDSKYWGADTEATTTEG